MPEKRLERTRASLPPSYQFGDAREKNWDSHYVQPVGRMMRDPAAYAEYRKRCDIARELEPKTLSQIIPIWLNPTRGESR
jgi:hypothetical protein